MNGRAMAVAFLCVSSAALFAQEPPPPPAAPALVARPNAGEATYELGPYVYDTAGNIAVIGAGDQAQYFLYDTSGRLVDANVSRPDVPGMQRQTYAYDVYGNMTSRTTPSAVTLALDTAAATNHLTGLSATYDAAGNLTQWQPPGSANVYQNTYDAFNMVKQATAVNAAHRVLYVYTADDERLWTYDILTNHPTPTTTSTTITEDWKIRDLNGKVLRSYRVVDGAWSLYRDYFYRDGTLLAAAGPSATEHFSLDHLGTPRVITDNNRLRIGFHHYFPFGDEWTTTSGAQEGEVLKFTGHERDADPAGGGGRTGWITCMPGTTARGWGGSCRSIPV